MNPRTCYSCLRGRPKVDRLREVRRLDAFTPRQIGERPRQLQHPVALAPALRASASARCVGVGGEAGALAVLYCRKPGRLPRPRGFHLRPDRAERRPPMVRRGVRCRCDRRELLEGDARDFDVDIDAIQQRAGEPLLVAADQG